VWATHGTGMADDSDLEKTEPASDRRLEKAREEGQTPRSRELVTFLMLLAGVGTLWLGSGILYSGLHGVVVNGLQFDPRIGFDTQAMLAGAGLGAFNGLLALAPLFIVLVAVAIGASVALGGLVISGKPLQPNLGKLNPIKGFARIFSVNTLVELGKAIAKAVLIGLVATLALRHNMDAMLGLMHLAPSAALATSLKLVATCCAVIIASLVIIAAL